ncbi:Bug family tripartite tricarboxylate transporter substrate binding protein [Roseomonas populi]|uniref:Tripartite tricarboxylate transporter substrate binding protein n=1 Tax=Roseomonas populi TaxID=3121582 RepID=A0ABT1WY02_9PROT|nr:tripartite tricarboxylate transporter substrate binding protein [Roseomonas pecuniae]MCR0980725.1 tripartite tricarboxylate transporter substrate binding protein [Roseomonas pecuniae]
MNAPHPSRRALLAAGLTLPWIGTAARAAEWPDRPVRIIVPFAPGGPADGLARMLAEQVLAPKLGQNVIVENRAGAGGVIGTAAAAQANDAHTLLFGSISMTIVPHLQAQPVGYDVLRDFTALAQIASTPFLLVVPARSAIPDVRALVAAAKANKGMSAANSGYGTLSHLTAELFNRQAGIDLLPVVYRGEGVLMPDLLSGSVELGFLTLSSVLPHLRAGTLRALAVAGPTRLPELPEVPTLAEAGYPGVEVDGWQAMFAPRGVPAEAAGRLSGILAAAMADPAIRQRITTFGAVPATRSNADFTAMVPEEFRRWGALIKERNIKTE